MASALEVLELFDLLIFKYTVLHILGLSFACDITVLTSFFSVFCLISQRMAHFFLHGFTSKKITPFHGMTFYLSLVHVLSLENIILVAGPKADSSMYFLKALCTKQRVAYMADSQQITCSISKGKRHGSILLHYTDIFNCVLISNHTRQIDPVRLILHEQGDRCQRRKKKQHGFHF